MKILDKARGSMTRSNFIDAAIYVFIASASLMEADENLAPTNKKKA